MSPVIKQIDNTYWLCCQNCGHKLAKLINYNGKPFLSGSVQMEFKCTSCKLINLFGEANDKAKKTSAQDNLKAVMLNFRAKHDLSMEQMAKIVGVTTQTIYNLENDLSNPTRLTVSKIMRAINEMDNND